MNEYLNIQEYAEIVGRSDKTIYKRLKTGVLDKYIRTEGKQTFLHFCALSLYGIMEYQGHSTESGEPCECKEEDENKATTCEREVEFDSKTEEQEVESNEKEEEQVESVVLVGNVDVDYLMNENKELREQLGQALSQVEKAYLQLDAALEMANEEKDKKDRLSNQLIQTQSEYLALEKKQQQNMLAMYNEKQEPEEKKSWWKRLFR